MGVGVFVEVVSNYPPPNKKQRRASPKTKPKQREERTGRDHPRKKIRTRPPDDPTTKKDSKALDRTKKKAPNHQTKEESKAQKTTSKLEGRTPRKQKRRASPQTTPMQRDERHGPDQPRKKLRTRPPDHPK